MSSINLKRIKEIRQLQEHGQFSDPIPLGSEGQYIDISSNLDLEEQLKLGGNHKVEIIETDNQTKIVEYYLSSSTATNDSAVYKVETNIMFGGSIKLLTKQQFDQNDENEQNTYLVTENNVFIIVGTSEEEINSKLFKGFNQLHTKTISFDQSQSNKTIIIEGVNI